MLMNKDFYLKESKIFCMQPWVSGHTAFNRFYNCEFETSELIDNSLNNLILKSNIKSIKNLSHYNELRKAMLENDTANPILNKICSKCILSKSWNLNNGHHLANKIFSDSFHEYVIENTNKDGSLKDTNKKIKYIHLSFSNVCNKCCIFCSPTRSNIIAKIYSKNVYFDKNYYNDYEYRINKKYLKNIFKIVEEAEIIHASVAGEPLIQEEFYLTLNHLIDNNLTDKTILLNTNLYNLTFKNYSILEKLKMFKKVILLVSIQGFDKENSIIMDRNYNKKSYYRVIANIKEAKSKLKNLELNIHCSLNLINYKNIFEYHLYPLKEGIIDSHEIILDYVFEKPLSLAYLPLEERQVFMNEIDNHLVSNSFNKNLNFFGDTVQHTYSSLKNYLANEKDLSYENGEFSKYLKNIETLKGVDIMKELPHLNTLVQYYEKFSSQ